MWNILLYASTLWFVRLNWEMKKEKKPQAKETFYFSECWAFGCLCTRHSISKSISTIWCGFSIYLRADCTKSAFDKKKMLCWLFRLPLELIVSTELKKKQSNGLFVLKMTLVRHSDWATGKCSRKYNHRSNCLWCTIKEKMCWPQRKREISFTICHKCTRIRRHVASRPRNGLTVFWQGNNQNETKPSHLWFIFQWSEWALRWLLNRKF